MSTYLSLDALCVERNCPNCTRPQLRSQSKVKHRKQLYGCLCSLQGKMKRKGRRGAIEAFTVWNDVHGRTRLMIVRVKKQPEVYNPLLSPYCLSTLNVSLRRRRVCVSHAAVVARVRVCMKSHHGLGRRQSDCSIPVMKRPFPQPWKL